jgi:esterase/lipase superfamily enzyme
MPLRRFGTGGLPLVYVPSSGGDVEEFERYGMPEVIAPWSGGGRVVVYAIDGWARHALWNERIPAPERMRAHARYERYVAEELLPWIRERSEGDLPLIVGCSYGAFVAANMLFKYPDRVRGACGLGGVYGMWHRLDGHHDDDVYFHTPLEYLPRLDDPAILAAIRRTEGLALFAAARDEWLWSTRRMLDVVKNRRLPHSIDVWPPPANHHQRWWREQLAVCLRRRLGASVPC